ncbi:MAG: hypothetical protein NC133_04220 [Prevotella sp.]|nr:hypothetical protein [Prevotella sp.]
MMANDVQQKILFVGKERIRPQIAYVLNIPDYVTAEKLTKQNLDQFHDCQIYVCDFKRKSRKYVKIGKEVRQLEIKYLDDICRQIDEEYYANRQRHAQKNNLQNVKKLPVAATNQATQNPLPVAVSSSNTHLLLFRHILYAVKHPSQVAKYIIKGVRDIAHAHSQKHLCSLHPSKLFLYVLHAQPNNKIHCNCLETDFLVDEDNNIKGCRNAIVPFGNLSNNGEINEIYHSTYARIVKLSSLNQSYCLCNHRWCYGCHKKKIIPTKQWKTSTYLQRRHISLSSVGTFFDEKIWQLIINGYNTSDIEISVDAATAETYRKLRGADFENLMKNLTILCDLHRKKQIRKLVLNFVVQRDNFREMPAFVRLGQTLGVDCVNFQRMNFKNSIYTPQELHEHCLIIDNKYLDYELWCVLEDPIFQEPIVDLRELQRYIDASERRYHQRYGQEQHRQSLIQEYLFIGPKRICPQIAYVLNFKDYTIVKKITAKNYNQYCNCKILVCDFKRKSRKYVKIGQEVEQLQIQYLDDICRQIDEEYYANHQRHVQENNLQISNAKRNFIRDAIKNYKCRDYAYLQDYLRDLKPSQLLVYVLYAPIKQNIYCTLFEERMQISANTEVRSCCSAMVPFGYLQRDGELDEIYNSTYARIIKLSSLNRSYCLCNFNRWCQCCDNNGKIIPNKQWQTSPFPQKMTLAFDKSCNLVCKSCRSKPYVSDDVARQRCELVVKKVLRSGYLELTKTLVLGGNGETFYSPYYRALLTTDLQREQINIRSNGTLFNEDNWRLVAGKYKTITVNISVDAATAETYQKLRGGDFEYLMKNLTMLSGLRRNQQIEYFMLNFVVQRDNFREMSAFVRLGQTLGVDRVNFQRINYFADMAYSPQEFQEHCLIIDNHYLDYALWCVLQDPIFQDPIVDLRGLQRYIDASERRYRQRYEREQRAHSNGVEKTLP